LRLNHSGPTNTLRTSWSYRIIEFGRLLVSQIRWKNHSKATPTVTFAGGADARQIRPSTSTTGLCDVCNSTRSQPFDLAYESFVTFVRRNEEHILRDERLDLALVFGRKWVSALADVRRYFVKHACCRISDAGLRVGEDLLSFLDGARLDVPFYLVAEIRSDILERLGEGANRLGSLWLGDLLGWHSPDDPRIIRIESHYGMGWLRFCWTYDPLARDWPDNMHAQMVTLPKGRSLDPIPEDATG
jgi:hypothetical protein